MNHDEAAHAVAQEGLRLIENAILRLLEANPQGLRNFEIADLLGLRSTSFGNQRNFLTYSVLGNLIDEGKVVKEGIRYRKTLAQTDSC